MHHINMPARMPHMTQATHVIPTSESERTRDARHAIGRIHRAPARYRNRIGRALMIHVSWGGYDSGVQARLQVRDLDCAVTTWIEKSKPPLTLLTGTYLRLYERA